MPYPMPVPPPVTSAIFPSPDFPLPAMRDRSTEFIHDVDADDVIEALFGREAELLGALCIEIGGPTRNDPADRLVRFAANEPHRLIACNAPQGLDLLAHGGGQARHCKIAPRPHLLEIEPCRMN